MKIEVLSHYLFDEKMRELNLDDSNIENTDIACISIIGTKECLKYYLNEEDTKHYFKNHPNVLNLDFDDISTDVEYDGYIFRTMTMEQAENTVDFIEKIIESWPNTIYIHCRAGYSRSRAIGEFIYRYCVEHNIDVEYADRNDYSTFLNQGVLRRLNNAYWKKHKENGYDEEWKEYPEDLLDHTPRHVEVD